MSIDTPGLKASRQLLTRLRPHGCERHGPRNRETAKREGGFFLLTGQRSVRYSCGVAKGKPGTPAKLDVLQGTLDLMVLQTLDSMGPQHGYGIARRIEQVSEDLLRLNEGTVYAALMRLQHQRWIVASWGASENNRKAKFYEITRAGKKQLAQQTAKWERITRVIARLMRPAEQR